MHACGVDWEDCISFWLFYWMLDFRMWLVLAKFQLPFSAVCKVHFIHFNHSTEKLQNVYRRKKRQAFQEMVLRVGIGESYKKWFYLSFLQNSRVQLLYPRATDWLADWLTYFSQRLNHHSPKEIKKERKKTEISSAEHEYWILRLRFDLKLLLATEKGFPSYLRKVNSKQTDEIV